MDIREETRLIRLKAWREIINDRIESGLTIKEYCKEHNLSRNAYFYWLRRLRAEELGKKENTFTELIVSDVPSTQIAVRSAITINVGRASITVQDKDTLRTVVEVLLNAQ